MAEEKIENPETAPKETPLERAVREIGEQTAPRRESLLLNGYTTSNDSNYMSKTIDGMYIIFRRNAKGLYYRVESFSNALPYSNAIEKPSNL
jgi:hypothetical protein